MDNQHKKISGYRDLTQLEVDSMNYVKELERHAAKLLGQLSQLDGVNHRDLALARTHFEDACIRAVRAVARPVSPFEVQ